MDSTPTPRWETAVMAGSFILIWAWFLARQAAYKGAVALAPLWNVALLLAAVALVVVFVGRLRRTLDSLRENDPTQRGGKRKL